MSIHVALNHITHYRYDRAGDARAAETVRLRSGAALAHAHPQLLDEGRAEQPLHQLAAGPAGQLPSRGSFSPSARATSASRSISSPRWRSSTRSTSSWSRAPRRSRSPTSRSSWSSWHPTCARRRRRRLLRRVPGARRSHAALDEHLPCRHQPGPAEGHRVPDPHGARRADAELTLQIASGSCRDSAWLMVQLLAPSRGWRRGSSPATLIQLKSDVKSLDGPSGTEVDFTDLHAWCEVYLPGAGWIGPSIRPPASTPARATSRSRARPSRRRRRRSAASSRPARRPSSTTCRCSASGKRRA